MEQHGFLAHRHAAERRTAKSGRRRIGEGENMETYTKGTIHNVTHPERGTVAIVAENQEKKLYRVSNGDKAWTCSATQLEVHGWRMKTESKVPS